MRARVSFTHVGHSESVVRGQPSVGNDRCELFGRGFDAHDGRNVPDATRRLIVWSTCQAAFATDDAAASSCRAAGMRVSSPVEPALYVIKIGAWLSIPSAG